MIPIMIGYDYDSMVDETILSLINHVFPISKSTSVKFDFAQYFSIAILKQL